MDAVQFGGADGVRPIDCVHQNPGTSLAPLQRKPKSLSSFVAGYKSSVTARARGELKMTDIWQRNYYDHIIRSENDFMHIWNYIDANLQLWHEDKLKPTSPPNIFNQK
jgi:hypothetical protein